MLHSFHRLMIRWQLLTIEILVWALKAAVMLLERFQLVVQCRLARYSAVLAPSQLRQNLPIFKYVNLCIEL